MRFKIGHTEGSENRNLIYEEYEYSFDMSPWDNAIDFELALNKLTMSVVGDKVIQISGFCGLTKEMNSNIGIPKYEKGALIVEHNFEHGFTYGIDDEDLPVQLNTSTGWVCIGAANEVGQGIEFINNCVAVISDNGEFLSLWLKPIKFPIL